MAETTKTTETKTAAPTPQVNVGELLKTVEAKLDALAGKPGFNPFLFHAQHVAPLKAELATGKVTSELAVKLQKVADMIPKLPEPPKK